MEIIIPKRTIIITPDEYPSEFLSGCRLRLPLWGYQHRMVGNKFADYSGHGNHGTPFGGYYERQGQTRVRGLDGVDDRWTTESFAKGNTIVIRSWIFPNSSAILQIYNGNGPPSAVAEISSGNIQGRMYNGTSSVGICVGSAVEVGKWVLVEYEYSYNDKAILSENGRTKSEATAPDPLQHTSQSYIGCHPSLTGFFSGAITEVLVYFRTRSDEERRAQFLWDIQHLPFLVGATYLRKYA